jgi:hypothetical protein
MEPKIVKPEQLEQLRNLQAAFVNITRRYGELKYDQLVMNTQLEDLEAQMLELEATRLQAIRTLQEEFGASGTVSLETGEFIPE